MSSLIKFTPLSGAKNEQPLCYLLEIDEACILLDCGWDETFDLRLVQQLRKIAPRIDAILLTHCDVSHLGALPFIMAQQGVKAKVYATLPVVKMGQLTVYDAVLSRSNREDFDVFNLDDIDAAWEFDEKKQGFKHFVPLRYQQSAQLEGRAEGISICPLNAGHTVGGAVWKITKDSESIVYAVDYNHAQERHLDGTVLENLERPSVLITDAYTMLDRPLADENGKPLSTKKAREEKLRERILRVLSGGGNVLIPVDATGRVLELLLLLEAFWSDPALGPNLQRNYTLAYLTPVSRSTVDMARSQTEWLSKHVSHTFLDSRQNIFNFKHLKCCGSRKELARLPGPQVVLAAGVDLETSSEALDLFAEWVSDSRNAVILTQKARADSNARRLHDCLVHGRALPPAMSLQLYRRVPLEGQELREHEERARAAKLEAERLQAELDGDADGDVDGGPDPDEEEQGPADLPGAGAGGGITPEKRAASAAAAAGGRTPAGGPAGKRHRAGGWREGRFPMYPHVEESATFGAYGEEMDTSPLLRPDQDDVMAGSSADPAAAFGAMTPLFGEEAPAEPVEAVAPTVPTKSILHTSKVPLACSISFLDFGGRSGAASVYTILDRLRPAKVILVHGSEACTEELRSFCARKVCGADNVRTPAVGESVEASSDTNIYRVTLETGLAQSLHFVHVPAAAGGGGAGGGYDAAYLDAIAKLPPPGAAAPAGPGGKAEAAIPTLVRNPDASAATKPFALLPKVKEVLPRLKALLESEEKYKSELQGGQLIVNGTVIVRRSGTRLILEGGVCKEYTTVRRHLLSLHHTL